MGVTWTKLTQSYENPDVHCQEMFVIIKKLEIPFSTKVPHIPIYAHGQVFSCASYCSPCNIIYLFITAYVLRTHLNDIDLSLVYAIRVSSHNICFYKLVDVIQMSTHNVCLQVRTHIT